MKKPYLLIWVLTGALSVSALADKSTKIIRGGLGFLFPDHNSFSNPGQFPLGYGSAFEAGYQRANGANPQQAVTPSFVYGNGKVGLGAFYSRGGTSLTNSTASDSVGVGAGVSFLKDKLTMGLSYDTDLQTSRTSDGNLLFTANMNGPQRRGPSIGLSLGSTVNAAGGDRQKANFGFGYSFRSNNSLEGGITFNDIRDTGDYSPYVAGTFGSQFIYAGGYYTYAKLAATHSVAARVGFILGRYLDLSALASYVLKTGGAATYGATFRASF